MPCQVHLYSLRRQQEELSHHSISYSNSDDDCDDSSSSSEEVDEDKKHCVDHSMPSLKENKEEISDNVPEEISLCPPPSLPSKSKAPVGEFDLIPAEINEGRNYLKMKHKADVISGKTLAAPSLSVKEAHVKDNMKKGAMNVSYKKEQAPGTAASKSSRRRAAEVRGLTRMQQNMTLDDWRGRAGLPSRVNDSSIWASGKLFSKARFPRRDKASFSSILKHPHKYCQHCGGRKG